MKERSNILPSSTGIYIYIQTLNLPVHEPFGLGHKQDHVTSQSNHAFKLDCSNSNCFWFKLQMVNNTAYFKFVLPTQS